MVSTPFGPPWSRRLQAGSQIRWSATSSRFTRCRWPPFRVRRFLARLVARPVRSRRPVERQSVGTLARLALSVRPEAPTQGGAADSTGKDALLHQQILDRDNEEVIQPASSG